MRGDGSTFSYGGLDGRIGQYHAKEGPPSHGHGIFFQWGRWLYLLWTIFILWHSFALNVCIYHACIYLIKTYRLKVQTREKVRAEWRSERWPLLTVETEVSGDSKSTNERGLFLGWLVWVVMQVKEIFVLLWLL
jgi:hypothetical protein